MSYVNSSINIAFVYLIRSLPAGVTSTVAVIPALAVAGNVFGVGVIKTVNFGEVPLPAVAEDLIEEI